MLIMPLSYPKRRRRYLRRPAAIVLTAECGCAADTLARATAWEDLRDHRHGRLDHRDRPDPYPGRRVPETSGRRANRAPCPGERVLGRRPCLPDLGARRGQTSRGDDGTG